MRCAKCGVAVLCGGSVCHGHMCIVLYLKLIWCNSFTDIYTSLEVGGFNLPWYMCIVLYMNLFGVMIFQTPMIDWRRGSGINLP